MRRIPQMLRICCWMIVPALIVSCGGVGATQAPGGTVQVTISPSSSSLQVGAQQQFTATVTGTSNTAASWSVSGVPGGNSTLGTVTSSGLYTAPVTVPSPATVTVTATSQADSSKSATAQVTLTSPSGGVSVLIAPTAVSLTSGDTRVFNAVVTGTSNTAVQWTASGGTISPGSGSTATYTAPGTPGSYTVTATSAADASKSATAQVTVTSSGPSIAITPTTAALTPGGTQTFSAAITGTSGTVQWTASGGTVSPSTGSSVTYTAPSAAGTYTINATIAGTNVSQSAFVTVLTPSSPGAFLYPTTSTIPVQGVQTLTAYVTGALNHGVSWSVSPAGPTFVGSVSSSTVGVKSSIPGAFVVTATSVADNTKSASAVVTFTTAPPNLQNAAVHPRIFYTAPDVARMRAWTIPTNRAWQALQFQISDPQNGTDAAVTAHFCFPGGSACTLKASDCTTNTTVQPGYFDACWASKYDNGNPAGGQLTNTEDNALVYAFASLIDPNAANRTLWANHAHDVIMWELATACGVAVGSAPPYNCTEVSGGFQDPRFVIINRAQVYGPDFGKIVDWTYSTYSANEKKLIQAVFLKWGREILSTTVGNAAAEEYVSPIGVYNDPRLFGGTSTQGNVYTTRFSANNHSTGHFQLLVSMGLALDPADDVPVNSAKPFDYVDPISGAPNSARALLRGAIGGYLYKIYGNYEDAHVVSAVYGLADPFPCSALPKDSSVTCFGQAQGGSSLEGTGYDAESARNISQALYMLHTSGVDDPKKWGPQVSMMSSSYWDQYEIAHYHQLVPKPYLLNAVGWTNWHHIVWGDIGDTEVTRNDLQLFYVLANLDYHTGNIARLKREKWYQFFVQFHGAKAFWGTDMDGDTQELVGSYGYFDPAAGDFDTAANSYAPIQQNDPRPKLPLDFLGQGSYGASHYFGRTDGTNTATSFDFHCTTGILNHEHGVCGKFDYFRKGETLLFGQGGYNYGSGSLRATPDYNNMMAVQPDPSFPCDPAHVDDTDSQLCLRGGQYMNAQGMGEAKFTASSYGPSYFFATADGTQAYSIQQGGYVPIATSITRSVFWLKPDFIVTYDRADTTKGSFRKWHLNSTATFNISGNTALMTSAGGQKVSVTSLLPAGTTLSTPALENDPGLPNESPVTSRLEIDVPGTPTSTRMLTVIQGLDAGSPSTPALVQSSAGTQFDGAVIGSTAVMFINNPSLPLVTTTYAVPSTTSVHYVSGLLPNTAYTVSVVSGSNKVVTITSVPGSVTTDAGGVLVLTTP